MKLKKLLSKLLVGIGLIVSGAAVTGCIILVLEEPVLPDSMM